MKAIVGRVVVTDEGTFLVPLGPSWEQEVIAAARALRDADPENDAEQDAATERLVDAVGAPA